TFGVVIFELATGQHPFFASSLIGIIRNHLEAPIPSARSYNDELPELFDRIMERALAKDPSKRFSTASEISRSMDMLLSRRDAVRPMSSLQAVAQNTITEIREQRNDSQINMLMDNFEQTRTPSSLDGTLDPYSTAVMLHTPGRALTPPGVEPTNNGNRFRGVATAVVGLLAIALVATLYFVSTGVSEPPETTEQVETRIALALQQTQTARPSETSTQTPTATATATSTVTPSPTTTPSPTPTVALIANQVANLFVSDENLQPVPIRGGETVASDNTYFQVNINHIGTELEDARLYAEPGTRILVDNVSNRGIQLYAFFNSVYLLNSGGYTSGAEMGIEGAPLAFFFVDEGASCAVIDYQSEQLVSFDCLTGTCSFSLEGQRGARQFVPEGQRIQVVVPDTIASNTFDIPQSNIFSYASLLENNSANEQDRLCVSRYIPTPTPTPTSTPTSTPTATSTSTPIPQVIVTQPPSGAANVYR
ncbi:MAG: hypothetical protein AAF125_15470, partial [Chloroflexota bacterium]